MSLGRQRKIKSEHMDSLKKKLTAVDNHIRKIQKLPATMFMHPQMLQHLMRQKTVHQITNQISLQTPKSILFNKNSDTTAYFNYIPLDNTKRYCLKIQPSHIVLTVQLLVDGQKIESFLVNKSRGIIIQKKKWKRAQFIFTPKVLEKLSLAKLQMTTITVQYEVKIHGIPSQKKIVDQKFKQFLQNNSSNQKIQQILQKRRRKSLSSGKSFRAKTAGTFSSTQKFQSYGSVRLFRNNTNFNESTSVKTKVTPVAHENRIQSAQLKRDFINFQASKSKFLKQLQNMGSQRANELANNKIKYLKQKKETLKSFSSLTIGFIFMLRIHKACIQLYIKKMKKLHIYFLCKRFIKNIFHANRTRIPLKVRNKLVFNDSLSLISVINFQQSIKRSEFKIIDSIKSQLFKLDVLKIGQLSETFGQKCKIIQKQFRIITDRYRKRFQIMVKNIKGYNIENEKQIQYYFKKYKQYCYTKSKRLKYGFMKYNKHIDDIIKQTKPQIKKSFQINKTKIEAK